MGTFLEKHNLSKLNEEEAESLNRPITPDETKAVIKKTHTKALDQIVSHGIFTKYLRKS